MSNYNPTIPVCSKCLRACCWQGEFMCDEAVGASIVKRKISTLIKGNYGEHPFWWNRLLYTAGKELLTVEDLKKLGVTNKEFLDLTDLEVVPAPDQIVGEKGTA